MTTTHRIRSADEILEHRLRITELHKEGVTLTDIAAVLGLPLYTVSRDLSAVRAAWQKTAIKNVDENRDRELAKIAIIEAEAWDAWEKSKQPRITKSATTGETVNKQSFKQEERGGDPRYLATIQWCSEQRSKLLGLVVTKVDMTTAGKPMQQIQLVEVRSSDDRNLPQSIIQ